MHHLISTRQLKKKRIDTKVSIVKLPKEEYAVAGREAKRRLENSLTKAQKAGKRAGDAERLRKIQRTTDRNIEIIRVMAERRSVVGAKGLAAEALPSTNS